MPATPDVIPIDYTKDILDYLRDRRGLRVKMMDVITDLTRRVSGKKKRAAIRGRLLSTIAKLIRHKKVIRYRKQTMVAKKPRSTQGFIRISEVYC